MSIKLYLACSLAIFFFSALLSGCLMRQKIEVIGEENLTPHEHASLTEWGSTCFVIVCFISMNLLAIEFWIW